MRSAPLIVASGLALAVVGCATPTRVNSRPEDPGIENSVSTRRSRPAASAIDASASLDDLVQHALVSHPGIVAAEAKVRRLMARVPQVASLADPKLKLAAGSMAETAAGRVDWMTGVEQALPYPGKLREMAKAAGKDAEAAAAQLESARLDVAAQVRQAYWSCYLASRTTQITAENRSILMLVRDSVDARVAANQGAQDDQLRLATEAGKLDMTLIESKQAEASARSRLNALLDRPSGSTLPNPKFSPSSRRGELNALLAAAEAQHPDVKAAHAQLEAFRHRLKRARLDRYPDFSLGVGHAAVSNSGLAPSANGRDQLFASVGISLPLWQAPRRARIDEATAGIEESSARIGAARASLRHEVEDAWLRAKSSDELIALFEKQILPESRQAFDGTLTGYAAGKQSFVDALDAWRQLLAFQLQQAGNQAQLGMAIAALRKATGNQTTP